ncbi:hypothetical protein [Niabella hibiscisoli]|uniref:hypothetical protein n=1 Tax=Niabella hibiscisoli TaxID=1825928 RepID=UPI001F0E115E|nr:hypothetical protein [Niabella hibiscisoli]MCH5716824.1 hypothetical protein [Niabella hibiscisoli]
MKREGIFKYLEKYHQPLLKPLYQKAWNNNINNSMRPQNWARQSAFLLNMVLGRVMRFLKHR